MTALGSNLTVGISSRQNPKELILVPETGVCSFCHGSGLCHRCGGAGAHERAYRQPRPCQECDGTGKCALYKGSGSVGRKGSGKWAGGKVIRRAQQGKFRTPSNSSSSPGCV